MGTTSYILGFDINIKTLNTKPHKHHVIMIDGEELAYYQSDDYSADGWYSYIKIKFSETEIKTEDLRRASNALEYFKKQILKRVSEFGHFKIGNFDTKKYIH